MNVRCAGDGEYQIIRTRGSKATFSDGGPCGWKGKRNRLVSNGRGTYRQDREALVAKPCPRCGGRVALSNG